MKFYNIIFLLLAITSCSGKGTSLKVVEVNSFPIEKNMSLTSLDIKDQLKDPRDVGVFCDALIVQDDGCDEGLVSLFSLKGDSVVKRVMQKGRGPNELLCVWGLTTEDSNGCFWAFDLMASDAMRINPSDVLASEKPLLKKVSFKDEAKSTFKINLLNDSIFICNGTFDGFRVAKVDMSGNVVDKVGLSPEVAGEKAFDPLLNEAYQGSSCVKPSGDKFVLACKYADQIEIFDSNKSDQELVVKGPIFKEPIFETRSSSQGDYMFFDRDETIVAYVGVVTTDDYVIGLFSGKQISDKKSARANIIHIFDWSGNPVTRLNLDMNCSSISIDTENNRVYFLAKDPVPEVYYFDLNLN